MINLKSELNQASLKEAYKANSQLLDKSLNELETFTKDELPKIIQSNNQAIQGLEQAANYLKALLNIKR